jgi:spermidine synthase
VAEDATGVAALTPLGSGAWRLYNNGWSHSSLPFGAHTLLGLAPVVAHPAPRDVAIIGLGSGDTAWGAGLREATEHIVVFEIRAGQEPLLRRLAAREDLPQLARLLADPRLEVRIEDGRRALQQERRLYDVIETDPQYPDAAGAGMLYSLEFYELCRTRLKPGGVMCAWAPTGRVTDTFRRVFRNTLVLPDAAILLGSDAALTVDAAAWRARLATDAARTYLAPFDPERAARQLLAAQSLGRGLKHPELLREPNRDLEPRDEFERRAFRRWPPR